MAGGDLWQFTLGRTRHLEKMQFGHDASSAVTSSSGNRLAYVQSRVNENIWRVDLDGAKAHAHKLLTSTREENGPNISPDGKKIVFVSNRAGSGEIWVCDSDGANAQQFTSFGGVLTGTPRWSPDGKQIAFDSRAGGEANIYLVDAGGGVPRKLETDTRVNSLPSWSHDGDWVYFVNAPAGSSPTVWRVAAAGGHAVQLTKTADADAHRISRRPLRLFRPQHAKASSVCGASDLTGPTKPWWMECHRSVLPAPNGGLFNRVFTSMETKRASRKWISWISVHRASGESTHPISLPNRGEEDLPSLPMASGCCTHGSMRQQATSCWSRTFIRGRLDHDEISLPRIAYCKRPPRKRSGVLQTTTRSES